MVSKKLKYLLGAFLIIAVSVALFVYIGYNRKSRKLEDLDTVERVTAAEIIQAYSTNKDAANKKYLDNIIEVRGMVVNVVNVQDTTSTILLGDSAQTSKVSCTLDRNNVAAAKKYRIGSIINVKGQCTGYLTDVELIRCVVVE